MKRRFIALALSVVVALGCAACGGADGDAPAAEGTTEEAAGGGESSGSDSGSSTVVVAMGSGFATVDPGYVYEKYPPLIVNACYENLFKFYDNEGAPEPCLADTYEFSEDNLTLTVTLKDGITFASGNPMSSADVLFSINRCKNLQGNPSFIADTIESMEAPDDKTIIFHLTQPDSAILSKLTYSALAILDSAVVKEHGGTDAEDASTADTAQAYLDSTSAGSGMYVMTSYIPDEEVVLEKNPNYWGEATNVDKYIVKIQPDSNTQMMTLSTGDIDVALNMTDDTMAELAGAENVEIINGASKTVGFVMMNMNEAYGGPVSDPKVQQAIRKALDYSGFQVICGEGTLTPYSIIQSGFMGSKGESGGLHESGGGKGSPCGSRLCGRIRRGPDGNGSGYGRYPADGPGSESQRRPFPGGDQCQHRISALGGGLRRRLPGRHSGLHGDVLGYGLQRPERTAGVFAGGGSRTSCRLDCPDEPGAGGSV